MIVEIPDAELVNATLPEGCPSWTDDARALWLQSKGVDPTRLLRQWSDPKARMHYYEVSEDAS